ncbi:RRQRL motif-containing zinc-binding protein [Streptomyces sp. NPDC017941]|uniref:RRQRL motif-containing zinc-binding protein n=1 Tax=unclassified Streptomyces TaxID=2593676 RepID=UPI0037A27D89
MTIGQGEDLADVDPHDPGDGSLPVHRWRQAGYTGLATRRQLRAMGLRPGGHAPAARIECHGGRRWAWLYRVDLALPKRTPTLAQEAALDRAMAARQTCPDCGRRYFYCLPLRSLGTCLECHDGTPADPTTYITPWHALAA